MSTVKKFASGKHALGICDRCGGTFKLKTLKTERERRIPNGWLVCSDCWDDDHPQNFLHEVIRVDAEALRNPRPDSDEGRDLDGEVTFPPINGVA